MAAALAAGALACGFAAPASAQEEPNVTIAIVPGAVSPEDLAEVPGMSVGVMNAGLATVTSAQTYLDIGQGNRIFTSLYDGDEVRILRPASQVPHWDELVERAESAPADIVPGLLASTLEAEGVGVSADTELQTPALIAADREGRIERRSCDAAPCPGLSIVPAALEELDGLAAGLTGDDLLIAFEQAPPPERDGLAIGIAGAGFGEGDLTSDTTRTDGFVLATDIAPTVLNRYGIEEPDEFSGSPIRAEGESDAAGVAQRALRMTKVANRRKEVILYNLIIWVVLAGLAALATRGRAASLALSMLGLSTVYLPVALLVAAGLYPTEIEERLLVGLGAPALAALTLLLRRGWDALAIACGLTVAAYAIDVIVGSPLTARSLLGPNPGLGVRFFGIGNELESTLAILVPVGVGAGLAAWARRNGRAPSPRAALIAFLGFGSLAAAIFAAGRFGADVGAAIVFPVGAVVAALAVPGAIRGKRLVIALLAAPVAGLAALALADLLLGGDAHLSRSVLEAGGAEQLGDVFERRLRLSASSFDRATSQVMFWFAVICITVAVILRRRLLALLEREPLARAGLAGAAAAIAIGIVANDSGALFLTIGNVALLACLAFAWAQKLREGGSKPPVGGA